MLVLIRGTTEVMLVLIRGTTEVMLVLIRGTTEVMLVLIREVQQSKRYNRGNACPNKRGTTE